MRQFVEEKDCCGCTACYNICPQSAISMIPDKLGFRYPVVDEQLCTDCHLCEKICQFKSGYLTYDNAFKQNFYAARLIDTDQLMRSQSGGVFYTIAKLVLKKEGIIYGAAFDKSFIVRHFSAENLDELEKLRTVKYVQSDLNNIFKNIKKQLESGRLVLFSGTACQVAGLKSFIPQRFHGQLICVDLICHGVPSPAIWKDYLRFLERKYKSKIKTIHFRDKHFGWHGAIESFKFENYRITYRTTYNKLYFSGLSVRESCSTCPFTNIKRVGDITIGDYWGAEDGSIYNIDNKGVSVVLINTNKGASVFENIRSSLSIENLSLNDILRNQPQLQHPAALHIKYRQFVYDYKKKGFEYVARHYGAMGIKMQIIKIINRIISVRRKILRQCFNY